MERAHFQRSPKWGMVQMTVSDIHHSKDIPKAYERGEVSSGDEVEESDSDDEEGGSGSGSDSDSEISDDDGVRYAVKTGKTGRPKKMKIKEMTREERHAAMTVCRLGCGAEIRLVKR